MKNKRLFFFIKKREMFKKKREMFKKKMFNIKKQILNNFFSFNNTNFDNKKNTVLLIEPRFKKKEIIFLLANTFNKIGNNWNYVFYCGKSFKDLWGKILPGFIELRALEHDNFENSNVYNNFCKKKKLWESLYGDFILTIQLDTWIMNHSPYNISFFIDQNKSYIGGNMSYKWGYFNNINLHHEFRNFNGGLSLRKRLDMIKVIENYPSVETVNDQTDFLTENEDVYFTTGCIKLNLPIGDDELSSHFSLHGIYHEIYFGIHQPSNEIKQKINITNPFLKYLNSELKI
jgi:hypothetical protein